MKKWLVLPLLAFLLAGCAAQSLVQTEPGMEEALPSGPTWPESNGLYAPGSELEVQTEGAVKLCPLEEGVYRGLVSIGEELVLIQDGTNTELVLLTGHDLSIAVTRTLDGILTEHTGMLQVGMDGVAYYNEADKSLVFLNSSLAQISRLQLPDTIIGGVYLTPDFGNVYYCTDAGVQVMDMKTGITRLLRGQKGRWQSVTGILLDGRALRSRIELEDGSYITRIISCETGQSLWEGAYLNDLTALGSDYLLRMESGSVTEMVFGTGEKKPQNLWVDEETDTAVLLPDSRIITVTEEPWGSRLSIFDMDSGKCMAAEELPGISGIRSICADNHGSIWLLGRDLNTENTVICGWDPAKSPVSDDSSYSEPHYTVTDHNEEGIAGCVQAAQVIEEKYGVDILICQDAVAVTLGGYGFDCEYLVQAYEKYLPVLEEALALLPQEFYKAAAEKTESRVLHIGLVRAICGAEAYGTLPQMSGVQFWEDGEVYIFLALEEDLVGSFLHQMCHVMETRVLSVCTAYYEWDKQNPSGFQYDNDYIKNQYREENEYLSGEDRAFIDIFSMSFAKEDRARIFEYACMPDNAQYFQTQTMQKKLAVLCDGIRQAFAEEESCEAFLWEQYLRKDG